MAYWIFKSDPKIYKLAERLLCPEPRLTWQANQHWREILPGDLAFLCVTGAERGVQAVMRVDEGPREMEEMKSEQEFNKERDTQTKRRVVGTLTHRVPPSSLKDLAYAALQQIAGLENLSAYTGNPQGTNFPVTPAEGAILMKLVEDAINRAPGTKRP